MNPLSVCIIAKNEAANIKKCLRALSPLQCEIVVVDTGSEDDTVKIAKSCTSQVHHFTWIDDFSAARNFAAEKASNNLILAVDCDEYLSKANLPALMAAHDTHPAGVGMIERISSYPDPSGSGLQTMTERVGRLYDRRRFQYFDPVHESLRPAGSVKSVKAHETLSPSAEDDFLYYDVPLTFVHDGYENEYVRREKALRDLRLLTAQMEKDGEDPYLCYQIGKCHVVLKDYEKAAACFDKGLGFDLNPGLVYVQEMVEAYGYALLSLRQYEKALGLVSVYDAFANRADFCFLMGLIYMNNARFPEAITEFEKATTFTRYSVEGTNSYSAWYNIGVIHEVLGNIAEARAYYQKCGTYAPAKARLAELA